MVSDKKSFHKFKTEEYLSPVSVSIKLTGFIFLGIVGMLIILASFLKYNTTVKGTSLIRPLGGIRLVESQREGAISNIAVAANQVVQKGDVIATLEQTELQIQNSQLQQNLEQSELKLAQTELQIQLLEQQILAESQSLEQEVLIAQMDWSRLQQEYELQKISAQANLQELQANLDLARDEMERYQTLVATGAISELQLQEKQAAFKTAEARLIVAQSQLNPSLEPVRVAQERLKQTETRKTATLASLNQQKEALIQNRLEIETQILEAEKNLQRIEQALETSIVRAPIDGVILSLKVRNEQQFVTANEVIAEIMPNNVGLVIKTFIASEDIDKVQIGQTAKLQVNSCPYPDYGTLSGVVTAISPDVVPVDNLLANSQNLNYYEVTIRPAQLSLVNQNVTCNLQPGMKAQTVIISRQETFLQFILRKARLVSNY